jgi:hypothetical protein
MCGRLVATKNSTMKKQILIVLVGLLAPLFSNAQIQTAPENEKSKTSFAYSSSMFFTPVLSEKDGEHAIILGQYYLIDHEGNLRGDICPGIQIKQWKFGVMAGFLNNYENTVHAGVWLTGESKNKQWTFSGMYTRASFENWVEASGWCVIPIEKELSVGAGMQVKDNSIAPSVKIQFARVSVSIGAGTSYVTRGEHKIFVGLEFEPEFKE